MTQPTPLIQNRYQIERLLGTGGFARVYLARDQRLGRPVAVKEMSASRLDDLEQQQALTLFEQEARMLAQLDHPGLTNIWDYFQHDDRAYLVMEYVPGPTLRDLVISHGRPLPEPLTLACGVQLCAVLGYLHGRTPQVIFRDLKPGNVIVEDLDDGVAATPAMSPENLQLKLIDFGIARLFKPEQSADTLVIGTPGYASPEGYGHGQTDQRSDIYSLGATLHHLASGQAPSGLILPPLLDVNPQASPALARVIARATALKPDQRYQNVEALRRDLQAIAASELRPNTAPPLAPRLTVPLAPTQPRPAAAANLSPLPMAVIALLIIGMLALGGLALRALGQGNSASVPGTAAPQAAPITAAGLTGQLLYGQCPTRLNQCDIYREDLASQSRSQLIGGDINSSADISFDGTRITITRNSVVYLGPLAAPTERAISPAGVPSRYGAFSPDGRFVAYIENTNVDARLAIYDTATSTRRLVEPNFAQYGWVTWEGQGLTYAAADAGNGVQDIFVVAGDGASRNLTNTPAVNEEFPAWSPDGRSLVFAANAPSELATRQIVRLDAASGERTVLTTQPGPHTSPAYSPNGEFIAYASAVGGGRFQIWTMRADGGAAQQLRAEDESHYYLRWEK
ncbi:MAG: serine/threonine-protein kinase [Roseiflexaceae bacterium]|nr:serine/threonine-protein kinase [Roseiflexaceae bacterium]